MLKCYMLTKSYYIKKYSFLKEISDIVLVFFLIPLISCFNKTDSHICFSIHFDKFFWLKYMTKFGLTEIYSWEKEF